MLNEERMDRAQYIRCRSKPRGQTKKHKKNLEVFLTQVLHPFLDVLDLGAIQSMGLLNTYLRRKVKAYLETRFHNTIRPWIRRPLHFRVLMRRTAMVIGGSVPISMILRESWSPNDLNLYIPRWHMNKVMGHLTEREGYTVESYLLADTAGAPLDTSAARSFASFIKTSDNGVARISVTESRDLHAFSPIFQSNSTWAYNWITADAVTVAYPTLTLEKIGLTRCRKPLLGQEPTLKWRGRYRNERGFTPINQWEYRERCGQPCGGTCSARIRSTEDTLCLAMTFGEMGQRDFYNRRVWAIAGFSDINPCSNVECPFFSLSPQDMERRSGQIARCGSYS